MGVVCFALRGPNAADTIVPNPDDPQALNRYSYVLNNPLRYTDPTGHNPACAAGMGGGPLGVMAALACEVWFAVASVGPQVQALAVELQQLAPLAAELPAAMDPNVSPYAGADQASSVASGSASGQFDPGQFNFDPGNFDPNNNRPQNVGQEAHRQFRKEFRSQMADQGREEGAADYLTEKAIRDSSGNVVRNAQGHFGKPDAVDYVNHVIYDLKPWNPKGVAEIRRIYEAQLRLYEQLYLEAYGVKPLIEIIVYGQP